MPSGPDFFNCAFGHVNVNEPKSFDHDGTGRICLPFVFGCAVAQRLKLEPFAEFADDMDDNNTARFVSKWITAALTRSPSRSSSAQCHGQTIPTAVWKRFLL